MKKISDDSTQLAFIQCIKSVLPYNISLVDELSDLLKISSDSAYRRIRGESSLSIEEIILLCKHFKLSFDSFINNEHSVNFSYQSISCNTNSFICYLKNMKAGLEAILKYPAEQQQIIFAAEDIPVFHHFAHPALITFKLFYWNKSILNAPELEGEKFEGIDTEPALKMLTQEIYELYAKIPVIEIWSDNTINSTIKQIEFYWDAGIFLSKKDALLICNELNQMLARINKQAELSTQLNIYSKPVMTPKNYLLYHSDVMMGNSCFLSKRGNIKETYISYHTFNFMSTKNAIYCNETEAWLKNLIRKSNLISGVGEKQRYRYFKTMDDSLKNLIRKIEHA